MTTTPIDDYCSLVDDELSRHEHRSYWATDIVVALSTAVLLLLFVVGTVLVAWKLSEAINSLFPNFWGVLGIYLGAVCVWCAWKMKEGCYFFHCVRNSRSS